jgi:uncharacterized protein YoxC
MAVQQQGMVQISAALLDSLVTSVNELRDSVSQLRNQNDGLRQELSVVKTDFLTLQRNSGVKFAIQEAAS